VQAECWGTVLPCMPHLTRLEFLTVAVGDAILCAVGKSAPQLQRLVLGGDLWLLGTSQMGADAVAHVGHIELLSPRGQKWDPFKCSQNIQLLQLPCVKRVECRWLKLSVSDGGNKHCGSVWSPELCNCIECRRRGG
jgi:hypothetical protein